MVLALLMTVTGQFSRLSNRCLHQNQQMFRPRFSSVSQCTHEVCHNALMKKQRLFELKLASAFPPTLCPAWVHGAEPTSWQLYLPSPSTHRKVVWMAARDLPFPTYWPINFNFQECFFFGQRRVPQTQSLTRGCGAGVECFTSDRNPVVDHLQTVARRFVVRGSSSELADNNDMGEIRARRQDFAAGRAKNHKGGRHI